MPESDPNRWDRISRPSGPSHNSHMSLGVMLRQWRNVQRVNRTNNQKSKDRVTPYEVSASTKHSVVVQLGWKLITATHCAAVR